MKKKYCKLFGLDCVGVGDGGVNDDHDHNHDNDDDDDDSGLAALEKALLSVRSIAKTYLAPNIL